MPFMVMEMVKGQSLQQLLEERGRLSIAEAVQIVKQVLSALELTFQHRIVHRDIKPDNLLVDAHHNVKLVDLGLAKRMDGNQNLTQTGMVMGSPHYLAPEQAANAKAADGRADIYSLGCTMFHMINGAPPYQGETSLEIILKHFNGPMVELNELDPTVPRPLAQIVAKMMARNLADRYQTPTEVKADLAQWEAGQAFVEPIVSHRKTTRSKYVYPFALALLCLGLAIIGFGKFSSTGRDTPHESPSRDQHEVSEPEKPASKVRKKSALMSALVARDTKRLQWLLDRGTSPNVPQGTVSPLHYAVEIDETRYVRMLLEKGANPNCRDPFGETPLIYALRSDNRQMGSDLLDFGANPNVRDRNGHTPLQLAAGDPFWKRKLLEKGASPY
jgi:serine/threonine protein kinase